MGNAEEVIESADDKFLNELDFIAEEILGRGTEEQMRSLRDSYYAVRNNGLNVEGMCYCISTYANSELDSQTPGERGMGRVTTAVPRFGSYFRKQLDALTSERRVEINHHIRRLILTGYVTALMFGKPFYKGSIDAPSLFHKWLPLIYAEAPPSIQRTVLTVGEKALTQFKKFLQANSLKGGGLLSRDRTDEILFYYLQAGFALRSAEQ